MRLYVVTEQVDWGCNHNIGFFTGEGARQKAIDCARENHDSAMYGCDIEVYVLNDEGEFVDADEDVPYGPPSKD